MKADSVIYPVVLSVDENDSVPYFVDVPDFGRSTQGNDLADALEMAKDLISILAIEYQDKGIALPVPSDTSDLAQNKGDIVTLVSANLTNYRLRQSNKAVRKNVTIPSWLAAEADAVHISYSSTLQEALRDKLGAA
ncbi:MAG: type II toxin-antitoxin system HicB family antitoxin [Coriobacteriia bacterium]|nr:type II toxin-antitoxin system HicB family antitoxin [Coriobacteriia bacterium]